MRDFFSNSDFNSWAAIQEEDKNIIVITQRDSLSTFPSKSSLESEGESVQGTFRSDMCKKLHIYFDVCTLKRQSPENRSGLSI